MSAAHSDFRYDIQFYIDLHLLTNFANKETCSGWLIFFKNFMNLVSAMIYHIYTG